MAATGSIRLPTGQRMPTVGLGTWLSNGEAMKAAIDIGYRHIDTAQNYQNEDQLGEVMEQQIKDGKITREEMFITTKLIPMAMAPENVRRETEKSLKRLRTSYIDLYLIHFPVSFSNEDLDQGYKAPKYSDGTIKTTFIDPLDTWREMEKLVDDGLVKAIGVSNFNKEQLERFHTEARIKPVNHQIEVHAWLPQYDLVEFCQTRGITVTAYAPIGSPGKPAEVNFGPVVEPLLDEPLLKEIADKHGKTPSQILLRNLVQRDLVVVPKSVTPSRMKQNLEIFDFELTDEEMEMIKGLNRELRLFTFSFVGKPNMSHPYFPWPELKD
ncbi:aldo-keto reductase family 1 member A1-A-like isoform X2 [Watersipora subatra]|uniref:aldo-keto reductase family 1 member A1-A-like isoform X2 n=1 Tax=Watersipora subatra TaxID=2589382 RepID=UPI00355B4CEF